MGKRSAIASRLTSASRTPRRSSLFEFVSACLRDSVDQQVSDSVKESHESCKREANSHRVWIIQRLADLHGRLAFIQRIEMQPIDAIVEQFLALADGVIHAG